MDEGHKYADDMLDQLAKQIARSLTNDNKKAVDKIRRYLSRHKRFIEDLTEQVDKGIITEREFEQQMINKLTTGREWAKVRDEVAKDMHENQKKALMATGGILGAVYLFNRNTTSQTIERTIRIARKRFVKLPRVSTYKTVLPKVPKESLNRKWHRRKIESVVRQGMKKGHSVDKIARNVNKVTKADIISSYRNTRTAVTSAENLARMDAFIDAEEMGIPMEKQWYASKDNRTRTSHRIIDGERVPINEEFSNGLLYPADPAGDPAEVYNCRCTLMGVPDGIDLDAIADSPSGMGRMEWVAEKPVSKPYPISRREREELNEY